MNNNTGLFKIDFPNYDNLFIDEKKTETVDKTGNYQLTRFNTKMLNTKNINAENELSGRNYPLTRSGYNGFKLGTTQKFMDDRPVVLNTPELFNSAVYIRERKTCNSVKNTEYTRKIQDISYLPHPSVFYQPNTFTGINSREVKRNNYKKK